MTLSALPFGKYEGRTLLQVLLCDTDWFFYMLPKLYGKLRAEADELARKATAIKIPKKRPEKWNVEYWFEDDGSFRGLSFVRVKSAQFAKWSVRSQHVDLSRPYYRRPGHKRGNKKLIACLRRFYFEGKNITEKRWKAFFEDDRNFVRTRRGSGPDQRAGHDR